MDANCYSRDRDFAIISIASRKKIGLALEKTFAGFYIFISPSITQTPFNYLHLTNLQSTSGSILSMLPYFFTRGYY
jgi:hypothetical protein